MERARTGGTQELWLNVRDDNPDALDLYSDLGFRERARRTQWQVAESGIPSTASKEFQIIERPARFWPAQRAWLDQLHPEELAWYRGWNFKGLAYMNLRQWAALRDDKLQATLSWTPNGTRHEPLWLALGPDSAPEAATSLLVHARSELGKRRFILDHPVGPADESIRAAGFIPQRTLVWMRAEGATK
jgi:hypothetical protein